MQLQLWLLVDRSVVIGFVQAADWRGACCKLLGLVPETIYRGRIKTSWFRRNFGGLDEDLTEVKREQHARAYILQIIGGILMLDRSRNLVHLMWLLKLVNFREAGELNWGFAMLAILYWRCYVKVSLVEYVTVEMHESNRALQQFGFRQSIPVAPQYLDDLHHIDFREQTNENWPMFHAQFINIWNNRIHGKPYLYGKRRGIGNSIQGGHDGTLYMKRLASVYTNSIFFTQALYILPHFSTSTSMLGFVFGALSLMYYMPMPSTFSTTTYRPSMFQAQIESPLVMSSVYETQHSYTHSLLVIQTPPRSLFYQGGSPSQPPIPKLENAQWQLKMHGSQSTKGEDDDLLRPQPQPEVKPRRNPVCNRRPPRCGTNSNRHFD
ncbi:hypothetical protein Goshw_007329 [Gossypium schwendimanii]|uniref:Aminotransferase-like plant mobile domain-containing protein n=1 Tax=Gossypium schwendimanii TaxID=34291 RepID=A0A7J9KR24_GOSSC|nr:hypothetical protein [Gossypium schwendimanii]